MKNSDKQLEAQLLAIAGATPWFLDALLTVRSLGLASWCIGAGAVRNLVWDHLHGRNIPSRLPDIDVVYFDALSDEETEHELRAQLASMRPLLPWEVTNQAGVHLWFERDFGQRRAPFASLEDGVASWPEFATCVGITLMADGGMRVIAPYGLADLFSMTVRRNAARVSVATYQQRVAQKRYAERWPQVRIEPA